MKPALSKATETRHRGFVMIEIVIASAIIGLVVVALIQVGQLSLRLSRAASRRIAANFLLQEGVEATRLLRDRSWDANIAPLATTTAYFLAFNGSDYQLSTVEPAYIDGVFRRTIRTSDAYRTAQSDIASAGTNDPDARKMTVDVSWSAGAPTTTETVEFYMTNLFKN